MKKTIICLTFILSTGMVASAQTQESNVEPTGLEHARSIFDAISGVMVFNIYNANNYIFDLYANNILKKEDAFTKAAQQVNTLEYLITQLDREINGEGELKNLKKSDFNYLKELKKAVLILKNQAGHLKEHINGIEGSQSKFMIQKALALKQITRVMSKQ